MNHESAIKYHYYYYFFNVLIKIAPQASTSQKLKSTVLTQLEVLCKNGNFGNFQIAIKVLSNDKGKRVRGWFLLP